MFLLLYVCHVCVPQKDTNMACPYKALQIWVTHQSVNILWMKNSRELIFGKVVYMSWSSIVSQILDFIHWMVMILVLITWLVKTNNILWKSDVESSKQDQAQLDSKQKKCTLLSIFILNLFLQCCESCR